jgi:hypothetical protein
MTVHIRFECIARTFFIVIGISFLFSCPITDNGIGDIEIMGNWTGSDFVGDFTFTITNDDFSVSYNTGDTVHGDIVKYDNEVNFLIAYVDDHFVPEFIGKYLKIGWLSEPSSTLEMQSYDANDTSSAAEAETHVNWGPYTVTKV